MSDVKTKKTKTLKPGRRYYIMAKTRTIWKLICLWSKMQSNRKQSIILACEFMRKTFGDGDLIANAMKSQNENILAAMREFTADICAVEFDSNSSKIPNRVDVYFYNSDDDDPFSDDIFNWFNSQTSITASISFAIYSFIRTFGIRDTTSVIAEFVLKDRNMYDMTGTLSNDTAGVTDNIISKEVASE